jgi:hypothetical protein
MAVQLRMEEIMESKQDRATAITVEDVNVAASRAVDHADRRSDSIMKSIGGELIVCVCVFARVCVCVSVCVCV